MSTRRFCDLCNEPLTLPEDDEPFVRILEIGSTIAKAYVAITNEHEHPILDICNKCKLFIITDGEKPSTPTVATLQPFAAPAPIVVPPAPLRNFEPSLPGDRPNPRAG